MEETNSIMNHLTDYKAVMAHAKSDAKFDGYDWFGLSNAQKMRYTERVKQGFESAKLAVLG
jgi:hypothetical protein